jgi:hypothetical protein
MFGKEDECERSEAFKASADKAFYAVERLIHAKKYTILNQTPASH